MANLSFGELISMVQRDLDDRKERQWRVDEIKGWVREGHREVWKEFIEADEGHGQEEGTATYPASTRHTQLDTILAAGGREVLFVDSVADTTGLDATDPGVQVDQIRYTEQFRYNIDSTRPVQSSRRERRGWFQYGSPLRLGLTPTPSAARTLRILWTPAATMMVDLDDTPTGVPQDMQEAIAVYAEIQALARVKEDTRAQDARFARLIRKVANLADTRSRQESKRVRLVDPQDRLGPRRSVYL